MKQTGNYMDDRRENAVRRLQAKRGFRQHLVVYAVVNGSLVVIWALAGTGHFWPRWPVVGWGTGMACTGGAFMASGASPK